MTEGVGAFDASALVHLRRERGLSHDALGQLIGRARPNVIAWEKGMAKPSPAKLVELARALAVHPSKLTTTSSQMATLADLRAWAGLTQGDLAAEAELVRSTYSQLERGLLPLGPDVAGRLASALGVEVSDVERAYRRRTPPPQ
jgi:transcriptional regulator with XRE-family HTH domain